MIKSDLYTENNMGPVSCSDVIQVVSDVAGSIPVVGDAAQAAVGEAVGKAGNAVLRAMPVLVPLMANLPDIFQKLKDSMPKGKNPAPKRAVTTAKAAKACSGMSKGKVQTGAKKSKSGGTKDLNGEKTNGKAVCVNGKCFTGDTLVLTKSGLRPIKEICKGDDIYSRNEETGETGFQKVKEVFVTEAHTIYHIWLDGKEEVKTTAYHSFFVKDRGWVTAIQLREADLLETAEGTAGITGITKVRHDEPVDVYNFHVDEWNSFFVSKGLIYVHNNEEEHKTTTIELDPSETNPEAYLQKSLNEKKFVKADETYKNGWEDTNYSYEVRIHPGEKKHTDAEFIYRVGRKGKARDAHGQGPGIEYLGSDRNWYFKRDIQKDDALAKLTHIPLEID